MVRMVKRNKMLDKLTLVGLSATRLDDARLNVLVATRSGLGPVAVVVVGRSVSRVLTWTTAKRHAVQAVVEQLHAIATVICAVVIVWSRSGAVNSS